MTKIFKELYETKNYPILLFVKKEINVGDPSYYDFKIDEEYFEIRDGELIIKEKQNVYARIADNSWLEIKMGDGNFLDIAFDNVEDYDNYFEIQGRDLSNENRIILSKYLNNNIDDIKDFNCVSCGEEYSSSIKNEYKKCLCAICEHEELEDTY